MKSKKKLFAAAFSLLCNMRQHVPSGYHSRYSQDKQQFQSLEHVEVQPESHEE